MRRGWRRNDEPGRNTCAYFAVINNVLTFAAVPCIQVDDADACKAIGRGRSTGTLPFQLAGNIKHGGLVELAFGA